MAERGHARSLSSKLGKGFRFDKGLNLDHFVIGLRFRNVFDVTSWCFGSLFYFTVLLGAKLFQQPAGWSDGWPANLGRI